MKRKLTTREKVLVGLLVVVAVVLIRGWQGGGIGGWSEAADARTALPPLGDPPNVDMHLLARGVAEFDPNGRDLFQYYTPPAKPPIRAPKRERPTPTPPPRTAPAPPPQQQRVAGPPPPTFRYIGHVGEAHDKIAVFWEQEPIFAKVGEVFKDEFKLVEFKYEAVVIAYVDERWAGQTTELKQNP